MPKILSPLDRARQNYHEARQKLVNHMKAQSKKRGLYLEPEDSGQFDLFAHAMGSKHSLKKKAHQIADELGDKFDEWVQENKVIIPSDLKKSKWGALIKWDVKDVFGGIDALPKDFCGTLERLRLLEAETYSKWK